jgi:AcrR family transcriptional regulator
VTNAAEEWTEEERAEKIAEALASLGLDASAEDTGGGIVCVVTPRAAGGSISWGTADVTWGAVITDADGEQVSSISTDWPSDSEDIAATAKALLDASLRNGAAQGGA